MKTLTKAQAWREIARRIAEGDWGHLGFCREVQRLMAAKLITSNTAGEMIDRIELNMRADETCPILSSYWLTPGKTEERVLAALFFALEDEG